MGQMPDFSGLITYKINDLEKRLMPQIDYHLMRHIILNVYIQIYLKKWFSLFQIDSLLSSNKKVSSEPRAGD